MVECVPHFPSVAGQIASQEMLRGTGTDLRAAGRPFIFPENPNSTRRLTPCPRLFAGGVFGEQRANAGRGLVNAPPAFLSVRKVEEVGRTDVERFPDFFGAVGVVPHDGDLLGEVERCLQREVEVAVTRPKSAVSDPPSLPTGSASHTGRLRPRRSHATRTAKMTAPIMNPGIASFASAAWIWRQASCGAALRAAKFLRGHWLESP